MKLVMLLLVRDEADTVGLNMKFHLDQGVDFVVAIDNGSVDGTRDILDDFQRSGQARVFDEPGRDFAQSEWVSRGMEFARDSLQADWILSNDADEFWAPRKGTLRGMLIDSVPEQLVCRRLNMVFPWDAPETGAFSETLRWRVAAPQSRPRLKDVYHDPLPCPYFYLNLPPKLLMPARGLVAIAQGNHQASYDSAPPIGTAPLDIFHFPVRSHAQFERKIVQGGQAYLTNRTLPERAGWHWRRWYRAWQSTGIEAPLADALPSQAQLEKDLRTGRVVQDDRGAKLLAPYVGAAAGSGQ